MFLEHLMGSDIDSVYQKQVVEEEPIISTAPLFQKAPIRVFTV
jgi:hypothetical protein